MAMIAEVSSKLTKTEYLRTHESCSSIREFSSANCSWPGSSEGGIRSMFWLLISCVEPVGSRPIHVRVCRKPGQWNFRPAHPLRQRQNGPVPSASMSCSLSRAPSPNRPATVPYAASTGAHPAEILRITNLPMHSDPSPFTMSRIT